MHGIKLIWKHSSHFNTAPRLVVLFRMLGNDLIKNGMNHADGEHIFELEPPEAVEKIKLTIEVSDDDDDDVDDDDDGSPHLMALCDP